MNPGPPPSLPYAEEVNYWKTGQSSPDTWIDKARRQVEEAGGTVLAEAYGTMNGYGAFMLRFAFGTDLFEIKWPVLASSTGNDKAAKIQAATFLYHDVKAKCMAVKIKTPRVAFFEYLLLSDGRPAGSLLTPELEAHMPKLLA